MKTQWPVYILAGGKSSRFGSDKARALIGRQSLLERVATALKPIALQVTVVAERVGKYNDLGVVAIADRVPHLGPLGGLQTALDHCQRQWDGGWILLTACDLTELHLTWIEQLAERLGDAECAVAFRGRGWQPFPAFYHTSSNRVIERLLRERKPSMRSLLDELRAGSLPLPRDWPPVPQVNTPADMRLAGGS